MTGENRGVDSERTEEMRQEERRPLSFGKDLRKEYKPKKKRGFTLRILALAAVAVIVPVVVMFAQQWKPEEIISVDQSVQLVQVEKTDIASITVNVPGDETYTVEPIPGESYTDTYQIAGWPDTIQLDNSKLSDLFLLSNLVADMIVEENVSDLASYSLDEPLATVSINMIDGTKKTVHLGARLPTGSGWYLKMEGNNSVYKVGDYVARRINNTSRDVRNLEILSSITLENVDYILIQRRDDVNLELRREENNESFNIWSILQPEPLAGDIEAIGKLAEEINGVALSAYVDTTLDLATYGLDDPIAKVMLKDSSGTRLYFTVGDSVDDTSSYVKLEGSDEIYTVANTQLAFLKTATLTSVVDRFATIINIASVDRVQFLSGAKAYDLAIQRTEQYENGKLKMLANGEPDYIERYTIDGQVVGENPFKKIYQSIIGITIQGEVTGEVSGSAVIKTVFTFNTGADPVTTEYIPYQKDFYAIRQNGGSSLFYALRTTADAVESLLQACMLLPVAEDTTDAIAIDIDLGGGETRSFVRGIERTTYQGNEITPEEFESAYKRLTEISVADVNLRENSEPAYATITYRYTDGREIVLEFRQFTGSGSYYTMAAPGGKSQFLVSKQTFDNILMDFETQFTAE